MVRVGLALLLCGCVLLGASPDARGASLWDGTAPAPASWSVVSGGFLTVRDDAFMPGTTGPYRMLLSTGTSDDDNNGINAASATAVASFVAPDVTLAMLNQGGHPGFDAGGAVEGTAVKTSFTANPGDVLTISYDFLTIEPGAAYPLILPPNALSQLTDIEDDFAFVAVTHDAQTHLTRLADLLTPGMLTDIAGPSGGEFAYHTGPQTLHIPLSWGPGAYSVALGVMDGASAVSEQRGHWVESALLVNSVNVASPTAVPIPAAAPAGAVLIGGLALVRRARRR